MPIPQHGLNDSSFSINHLFSSSNACFSEDITANATFPLSDSFLSTSSINIDTIDIYSQDYFRNLIQEREAQKLPYFLAVTEDTIGNIQAVDGTTFMRAVFKYGQVTSSTTRSSIQKARFYMINHIRDQVFQFVCNLEQVKENKGHFAKFVNACDPDLDPKYRGLERFYMASIFEWGKLSSEGQVLAEKKIDQAFFWLNKSVEDGYFGAHIAFAHWYETGNDYVGKSSEKTFEHLKLALEKMPKDHPWSPGINKKCTEISRELQMNVRL
jgi:hypothetical protein